MREQRFWVGVACRQHVLGGKAGGFAQFCHGKLGPARRPRVGDGIVYYSAKEAMDSPAICQKFTALGVLADDHPIQVEQFPGFEPWRRSVDWKDLGEAEIRPLIGSLDFIQDKAHWGSPFRFGFLEISADDYNLIEAAMLSSRELLGSRYVGGAVLF